MSEEHKSATTLPEELKLALDHVEESSTRTRWIVFILQLAVVLVLASLWHETDYDWLALRLEAAQDAVKLLTCEPEQAFIPQLSPDDPDALSDREKQNLRANLLQIKKDAKPAESADLYMCEQFRAEHDGQRKGEEKKARSYLAIWGYSVEQIKKNVSDLQQLTTSRTLGVGVPVLGISFDVNDLSAIAGLTFAILLSWFYFNLRRQLKNLQWMFFVARNTKHNDRSYLGATYHLLSMTQVLAIPPESSADSRNVSFIRRVSRLPTMIMWTAPLTLMFVLIDDITTLGTTDYLSRLVNRAETAVAIYLFIYVVYRTIKCFELIGETDHEWVTAYNEICEEDERIKEHAAGRLLRRFKRSEVGIALVGFCVALFIHVLDEMRPFVLGVYKDSFLTFWSHLVAYLPQSLRVGLWIIRGALILTTAMLILNHFYLRRAISIALAWIFTAAAVLDVIAHTLRTFNEAAQSGFRQNMQGFYSSPVLIMIAIYLLFVLSERAVRVSKDGNSTGPGSKKEAKNKI